MSVPVTRWEHAKQVAAVIRLTPFDVSSPAGRSRERYRLIALNTLGTAGARAVGMAASLVTVPVMLAYLGKGEYGLWAAVTSFTTWIALFDFGVVNGLVNAVAEANGRGDRPAARSYIATAYLLLVAISAALGAVAAVALWWVPWETVFATRGVVSPSTLRWCVAAALIPVLAGLPLSVVRQAYAGYMRTYVSSGFLAAGSIAGVAGVLLAVRGGAGLPTLILVSGGVPAVAVALNLWYMAVADMPWLRPRVAFCTRRALRRLLATSVPLFLFQLGALLVNNTQLLILAHRASLATVADYSILMRLYVVLASFIGFSTSAFVPSFREAFERGDGAWLRTSFRRMLCLRMAIAGTIALSLTGAGNWLIQAWLHEPSVRFGTDVWIGVAVLMVAATWVTAFGDLLTILDRIWVQVGLVAVNGVVTAGLTYALVPRHGVAGAVFAIACVTVLLSSWVLPVAARGSLLARKPESAPA
jgi:O-antigen/teichoic acid export membrane protein